MAKICSDSKGIFCLEGDWWGDLKRPSSVEPVLALLKSLPPRYVPYIHKDVGTRTEFDYYVNKWVQKVHSSHPILYLAFHGGEETIQFGDLRRPENTVSLDDLQDMLANRCKGRIVYFSSCKTLATHGNRIHSFLKHTNALAVCGFSDRVDWLTSLAFDLLFLRQTQYNAFTIPGARAIERHVREEAAGLANRLGFKMWIRKKG